jgi:hypothetical protein
MSKHEGKCPSQSQQLTHISSGVVHEQAVPLGVLWVDEGAPSRIRGVAVGAASWAVGDEGLARGQPRPGLAVGARLNQLAHHPPPATLGWVEAGVLGVVKERGEAEVEAGAPARPAQAFSSSISSR